MLADLVARRRQIVEMIGAERQREKRADQAALQQEHRAPAQGAGEGARRLDTDIDDAVRGSPAWREKEDLLASVPGVGPVIARTLIAEMPELGTLDRRQIARPGRPGALDPTVRQVARQKLHRRRAHRVRVRAVHGRDGRRPAQPVLKAFVDRLIAAGKPKMVALIAVARKLLTILNAILRDNRPWQTA